MVDDFAAADEHRPLRVEVIVEGAVVPRWVASIVEGIEAAPFVELTRLVVAPEAKRRATKLGFRLYDELDLRLFRAAADAFEPTDLSSFLTRRPGQDNQDVVINFAWPAGTASSPSRFGEWSIHHGGARAWHSDPPFFWETYRKERVVTTVISAQRPGDNGRVIYRTVSATDLHSPRRGQNAACWKVRAIVLRRLEQLHEHGWSFMESLPTYAEPTGTRSSARAARPGALSLLGYLARLGARLFLSRLRKQVAAEEWFVGYRPGSWSAEPPAAPGFNPIPRVSERYFADPFVIVASRRRFVFFEDYRVHEDRAVISYVEITGEGVSEPIVVLDRPYHLSYPFVFRHAGTFFMIPETSANRTIELYRAERFPDSWVFERVLMSDVSAVDATLVEHAGRWWLFASVSEHGVPYSDELSLFSAPSLEGEWSPHPLNPIVSDVRRARPAGRVFVDKGTLIRPGQDSSGSYGSAVVFSRIEQLSETAFRETPIARFGPDWMPRNLGTHTYNSDGAFEVVDARRRRLKLGLAPSKLARK